MTPADNLRVADPLEAKPYPELFFGLVGPVGANLEAVSKMISEELEKVGYHAQLVQISSLIRGIRSYSDLKAWPEDDRIKAHMDAGTHIREITTRGDIFSLMSVAKIRAFREERTGSPDLPLKKYAYIFRSFKHPDEIISLRKIYGELFFLISAYLPRSKRVERLARIIAESRSEQKVDKFRERAEYLVNKDEEEEGKKLGQDVSDAFPLADFFVDTADTQKARAQISRFIALIFSHPFHTPTPDEMGMYLARSVALRSADLSRQVGAVIVNNVGDIISGGCNEVPKGGGGQYWPSDHDVRDYQLGYDSSAKYKRQIVRELVDRFRENSLLSKHLSDLSPDELARKFLSGEYKNVLKNAQILDLLEYGRPVHAEMAAISNAARLGLSVEAMSLYCTTFPCHMCARHIIAAGIKRVVYIEPYPKSKVKDLYNDSVAVDEDMWVDGKVNFEPFVGIAPRRYQNFFEMVRRKQEDGTKIEWRLATARPKVDDILSVYIFLEQKVMNVLPDVLHDSQLELA